MITFLKKKKNGCKSFYFILNLGHLSGAAKVENLDRSPRTMRSWANMGVSAGYGWLRGKYE